MNRVFFKRFNIESGETCLRRKESFLSKLQHWRKKLGASSSPFFPSFLSAVVSNLPRASQPPFLLPPH